MKIALSEIKKNLQGINSGGDQPKNQINNWEHNEGKSIQSEQQTKFFLKKMRMGLGTSGMYKHLNHRGEGRRGRTRT